MPSPSTKECEVNSSSTPQFAGKGDGEGMGCSCMNPGKATRTRLYRAHISVWKMFKTNKTNNSLSTQGRITATDPVP